MKKLLTLLLITVSTLACKKKDENVAIDMSLKTYTADAKFRTIPVILQLNFASNGTVKLRAYPTADIVTLKYEIGDKMASNTTLHIYGKLEKSLNADGLIEGTEIDWQTTIGRVSYKPEIVGFSANEYHFTSL